MINNLKSGYKLTQSGSEMSNPGRYFSFEMEALAKMA